MPSLLNAAPTRLSQSLTGATARAPPQAILLALEQSSYLGIGRGQSAPPPRPSRASASAFFCRNIARAAIDYASEHIIEREAYLLQRLYIHSFAEKHP